MAKQVSKPSKAKQDSKAAAKPVKAAPKPAGTAAKGRQSWLDDKTDTPQIDKYARQLDTFIQTMADGKVDEKEIQAQEKRLVKLMKDIEPRLDGDMHAKVTELLCELTAYDIMQMLQSMESGRPKTRFRG
jgi:hypothetical protein